MVVQPDLGQRRRGGQSGSASLNPGNPGAGRLGIPTDNVLPGVELPAQVGPNRGVSEVLPGPLVLHHSVEVVLDLVHVLGVVETNLVVL